MLEPNKNYVVDIYGNIHEMRFIGDCDWDEKTITSIQEIRNKAIEEFVKQLKENNRCITITDKGRTYIFQVNMLLKPSHMEKIRNQLKQQIQEGCVLLPPDIDLVKG